MNLLCIGLSRLGSLYSKILIPVVGKFGYDISLSATLTFYASKVLV